MGSDWVFPVSATPLTAPPGELTGVAVDATGNVNGAAYNNHFNFKVDTSGAFSIVAGNGVKGTSPDGPATGFRITCPRYLIFQPNGDLYFTGNGSDVHIPKVTPGGNIVTVAGGGQNADEGAPALQVKMYPYGLTLDAARNLYYSEAYLSQRIRCIGSDGVVRTIAGFIDGGFSGDGGPARNAALAGPRGIPPGATARSASPTGARVALHRRWGQRLALHSRWRQRLALHRRRGQPSRAPDHARWQHSHNCRYRCERQLWSTSGQTLSLSLPAACWSGSLLPPFAASPGTGSSPPWSETAPVCRRRRTGDFRFQPQALGRG